MPESHRSLKASARNLRMCSPVSSFHRAPGLFMRMVAKHLQVASALPLPMGRCWRLAEA